MQFTYVSLGTVMSVCFRRIEIQTGLEEGVVHEEGWETQALQVSFSGSKVLLLKVGSIPPRAPTLPGSLSTTQFLGPQSFWAGPVAEQGPRWLLSSVQLATLWSVYCFSAWVYIRITWEGLKCMCPGPTQSHWRGISGEFEIPQVTLMHKRGQKALPFAA